MTCIVAFIPIWNGIMKFEIDVRLTCNRIIYMDIRTFNCRSWDLFGIPCYHAIVACNFMGLKPKEFVDEMSEKTTFLTIFC